MPSIDPVLHADFRDYSYRADGVWRDSTSNGMLLVLDMATVDGKDLWLIACGLPIEN
jgi:hypothetical protein